MIQAPIRPLVKELCKEMLGREKGFHYLGLTVCDFPLAS